MSKGIFTRNNSGANLGSCLSEKWVGRYLMGLLAGDCENL